MKTPELQLAELELRVVYAAALLEAAAELLLAGLHDDDETAHPEPAPSGGEGQP